MESWLEARANQVDAQHMPTLGRRPHQRGIHMPAALPTLFRGARIRRVHVLTFSNLVSYAEATSASGLLHNPTCAHGFGRGEDATYQRNSPTGSGGSSMRSCTRWLKMTYVPRIYMMSVLWTTPNHINPWLLWSQSLPKDATAWLAPFPNAEWTGQSGLSKFYGWMAKCQKHDAAKFP